MKPICFTRVKIIQRDKELLVMVGRKRKQGKRERNGRLQREKPVTPLQIAALMPHRRWIPPDKDGKDQRGDQKAENPFGRLNLINAITDTEYDAGLKFRDVYLRYRAMIDSPNPNPGAISLDRIIAGPRTPLSPKEAIRRRTEYMRSFEAIEGHRVRVVISSVVIYEKELTQGDLFYLRVGLNNLAEYYGLTRQAKYASQK